MELYGVYLFVHIMLLVFWLGTDLGVFFAAKVSERSNLGGEARLTALQLGMVLDRLPRTCLTLIFPSGLLLASSGGYVSVPATLMTLVWLFFGVWLAYMWAGFLSPGTPLEERSQRINLRMNVLLAVAMFALGIASLGWATPQLPVWLALKILLLGLIGVSGVALDIVFRPATVRFQKIVAGEASEEDEASYSTELVPVYRWVLSIYALVAMAALLGTTKAL